MQKLTEMISSLYYNKSNKNVNYFTTCTLNHFRQLYRTAKNYKQLTERYFDFLSKKNCVLSNYDTPFSSEDEC